MHEVIGHGSGKVAERLHGNPQAALKEQFSALEESRADLVALYFLPDPQARRARPGRPQTITTTIVRAEYEALRAQRAGAAAPRPRGHADRRRPHAQPPDDRPLADGATRSAIEVRARDGKTYYVMTDVAAFRDGVGRLLAEVQRIKAEGDYAAAQALFETYGVHFDPALRDEVVARVDRLHLPSYTGFVMPQLEAVRRRAGRDHRRHDFVSPGPDGADARVLACHPPSPATVRQQSRTKHEGYEENHEEDKYRFSFSSSGLRDFVAFQGCAAFLIDAQPGARATRRHP